MSIYLLIDHDNLESPEDWPSQIFRPWIKEISQIHKWHELLGNTVEVRLYGGWFSELNTTRLREEVYLRSTNNWPSLIDVDGNIFRLVYRFADTLLALTGQYTGHGKITHTVKKKKRMEPIVATDFAKNCEEADCHRKMISKWTRSRKGCTASACPHSFSDCFERNEQKQVDVHLASDLLALAATNKQNLAIGVCSTDVDLTPAILTARAIRPSSFMDFHLSVFRKNQTAYYCDITLAQLNIKINRI